MTERYTGIPEQQEFAREAPKRTPSMKEEFLERVARNDVIPGIGRVNMTEAVYWLAFQEKLDAKLAVLRLEAIINHKAKRGQPTDVEEAEWRRLKLWAFTLEAVFKAAEPDILRPKDKNIWIRHAGEGSIQTSKSPARSNR